MANCDGDVCKFTTKVNLYAGETGYYTFEECGDTLNPTIGLEIGKTYVFDQSDVSNYYHPLGLAYFADGAHDDVDELEPGIAPPGSDSACADFMSCSAPMYFQAGEYLGTYSNDAMFANVTEGEDDFGLDHYEPQFFYPLPEWTSLGPFSVSLKFDDKDFGQDIFYFCHVSNLGHNVVYSNIRTPGFGHTNQSTYIYIPRDYLLTYNLTFLDSSHAMHPRHHKQIHQFMTGRIKLLKDGEPVQPDANLPAIPYQYDEPGQYDKFCGTHGLGDFQLPHDQCPEKFVCGVPEGNPELSRFASCIDSMDCHMVQGMTTGVKANSATALFLHQMIPHHQNAVNMAKALLKTGTLDCANMEDETDDCTLEVILREIINNQNKQIQDMRGLLESNGWPETDDCKVDILGSVSKNGDYGVSVAAPENSGTSASTKPFLTSATLLFVGAMGFTVI